MPTHSKSPNLWKSFTYAFRGVVVAFSTERNFRVQCYYAVVVTLLLLWFHPPLWGTLLVLLTVMLLLSAELANSALERVVDIVSPHTNLKAGEVKDLAAAAVMLVSFASAGTVLFVLSSTLEREALFSLGGLLLWITVRRSVGRGSL